MSGLKKISGYVGMTNTLAHGAYLPAWRQWLEMGVIMLRRRVGPGYYILGRMGKKDKSLSEKLSYYNGPDYVRRVAEVNDRLFHKVSQHKIIEAAVLNFFGIPSPASHGHLHSIYGTTRHGAALSTPDEFMQLLQSENIDRFVLKPCEGFEGKGFVPARRVGDMLQRMDGGDTVPADVFFKQYLDMDGDGYLVQSYFDQHPELAAFNPSSVNTVRMLVFSPKGKPPACFGARLRMGRAGSMVDNSSAGGVLAPIDMETGRVGVGTFYWPTTDKFSKHPDNDAPIEGVTLPFWEEAKTLSEKALQIFPHTRFVGLDVAFGKDGPVIIELNVQPDYGDFAVLGIPSIPALADD